MPRANGKEAANRRRIGAARFSVGSGVVLAAAKLLVGLATNSLGVLSSAIDNLADILMSGVNYLSIRKSMEPADRSHPYGHGKVETLATVFMSLVISLTGAWIIFVGVRRLRAGVVPGSVDAGMAVMAVSVVASWFIARRIRRVGEETGSNALKADSLHYRTDVFSGGGILFSLVAYRATGWKWLDPGSAVVIGAYVIFAAFPLLREALDDLIDRSLPPDTVARIRGIIDGHRPLVVDYHDLRSRRSGTDKHVDFHVVVCRRYSLEDAHRLADHLEKEVSQALDGADVVTHIDPCGIDCPGPERCERLLADVRKLTDPEPERRAGDDGESP